MLGIHGGTHHTGWLIEHEITARPVLTDFSIDTNVRKCTDNVSYIAGAFTINFDAALRQQQAHVFAFDADTFTEIAIEASNELLPEECGA